jgi:hypothetical protein
VFLSRFHLPVPLGSTVITRFAATTGTLTPARLLPAPGQVSLITKCAFPDIPSPTTPCAPVSRQCSLLRAGLTSDSPCRAVGGSSDFARCSQSRQSHKAVSSLCRGPFWPVSSTDYPFVSSCSPRPVARTQLLSTRGGKHRHRGTSTLQCTLILKRTSATVPVAVFGLWPKTSAPCENPLNGDSRPGVRLTVCAPHSPASLLPAAPIVRNAGFPANTRPPPSPQGSSPPRRRRPK